MTISLNKFSMKSNPYEKTLETKKYNIGHKVQQFNLIVLQPH